MKIFLSHSISALLLAGIFFSCHQKSNRVASLSAADSILIGELKSKSIPYYKTNQDSFAALQFQIADKYKQADQLGKWLNCYDTIIKAYRKHDSIQKSINCFVLLYKNIWREPADSFSLVTLAESNRQIGYIYYQVKQQYQKSIPFYDEGIKLVDRANGWNPDQAIHFFKAAANECTRLDDFAKAIDYFKQCYDVCRKFNDTASMIFTLNDWGIPYEELGRYDEAKRGYRESLELAQRIDLVEHCIDASINLSSVFLETNQLDSALWYNQKAFDFMARWKQKEPDSEADLFSNQAAIYTAMKKYRAAADSYDRAIVLMKSSSEGRRRDCGKIYNEFGGMYLEDNNSKQALEKFHSALQCFIPSFKSSTSEEIPDTGLLYDENGLLQACEGKGDCYLNLFQQTGNKHFLNLASENYSAAAYVQSKRILNMESEASRIEFEKKSKDIEAKKNRVDSLLRLQSPN